MISCMFTQCGPPLMQARVGFARKVSNPGAANAETVADLEHGRNGKVNEIL